MRGPGSAALGGAAGFTLVEVLIALVISGVVVLTMHGLFAAAVDRASAMDTAARAHARRANAYRWLGDALAAVDVGPERPGPFVGAQGTMRFTAWLMTPNGWSERQRVLLSLHNGQLVAQVGSDRPLVLADSVASVGFDYLVEHGESAPWLPAWTSAANPPLAVRLRLARASRGDPASAQVDTVLLLVGPRG